MGRQSVITAICGGLIAYGAWHGDVAKFIIVMVAMSAIIVSSMLYDR